MRCLDHRAQVLERCDPGNDATRSEDVATASPVLEASLRSRPDLLGRSLEEHGHRVDVTDHACSIADDAARESEVHLVIDLDHVGTCLRVQVEDSARVAADV